MKRRDAHKFKTAVLKDIDVKDKTIYRYDIYQDAADNGKLWLKYHNDKPIWIDTWEYFEDIFGGK